MSDNIQEKIMTITKVEKALTSTGKQLIKIKDNQNLSHQLWPIKQDGTESKAYQFFKTLPMDGIGMTARVSYKEERGDYNGKAVVYRTIIGMDNQQATNTQYRPQTLSTGSFKPQEAVKITDWDKISTGKVRHGVALEAIKRDMVLDVATDKWIKDWTNYIMTGELNLDNDLGINTNEIF